MENNLYYTPTLEDLHYGFEFEYKSKDDNWVKVTLDTWNSPSKENHLKYFTEHDLLRTLNHQDMACKYADLTCIRVKYLDQSDIESLGWTFKTKGPFRTWYTGSDSWFNNTIPTGDSGRYWSFELSHDIKYNGIIIKAGTNYGDTDTFFEGTIKNKSELIKLMQQLNIK